MNLSDKIPLFYTIALMVAAIDLVPFSCLDMKTAFVGGALSFKGDGKKKAKKVKRKIEKVKHELKVKESVAATVVEELTEAEKKAALRRQEREKECLKAVASKSHRERVEEFNEKLSQLTEHNDIPRISAAGNG